MSSAHRATQSLPQSALAKQTGGSGSDDLAALISPELNAGALAFDAMQGARDRA